MDALTIARRHETWRLDGCLNLLPSENVTSPEVRSLLASDFGHRYTLPIQSSVRGDYVENAYRGTRYTDQMEALGDDLAKRIFHGRHATLKPLSGHIAGLIMLLAACRRGDLVAVLHPDHGGYDGYSDAYIPDLLGLQVAYLPFDGATWSIRTEEAVALIEERRPTLVVLGQSFFPFPYDMAPLVRACRSVSARLGYDASHVLGLVAGGQFQDPLVEGADVLVGSTHKSLFGPQGGLLVTNDDELWAGVGRNLVWRTLDNAHWNRIAALTRALEESRRFGSSYARQVVSNTQTLASALNGHGFPLRFADLGFSRSHQLMIDTARMKSDHGLTPNDFAVRCEASAIMIDAVGRLGTNELTRMGAKGRQMKATAELLVGVLKGHRVASKARALRASLSMAYVGRQRHRQG